MLGIISCKAQVLDKFDPNVVDGQINGAYYKDVNGFRDQFVGTWLFSNGNTSFKVVFQKRDNLFNDSGRITFHEDILVGEYQYIENGVEKVNTLSNINTNYGSDYNFVINKHLLIGDMYLRRANSQPKCLECLPNERRMVFNLAEPNYNGLGISAPHLVVRKFTENGVNKIKVWFYNESQISIVDDNGNETTAPPFKLPYGEYILTKQ
jgi:hypothetical protein